MKILLIRDDRHVVELAAVQRTPLGFTIEIAIRAGFRDGGAYLRGASLHRALTLGFDTETVQHVAIGVKGSPTEIVFVAETDEEADLLNTCYMFERATERTLTVIGIAKHELLEEVRELGRIKTIAQAA